jgi:hypothetical protein
MRAFSGCDGVRKRFSAGNSFFSLLSAAWLTGLLARMPCRPLSWVEGA